MLLFEKRINNITNAIKSKILNKEDESKISRLSIESKEDFYELSSIASEALLYVMSRRAIEPIEYILMFWREKFIIPQVQDTSILELLNDFNKTWRAIVRVIFSYEVIINYSDSESKEVEQLINEVKSKSIPPSSQKDRNINKFASAGSEEEIKEDRKIHDFEEPTSSHSEREDKFEFNEVLPKRFTSGGEIMKIGHVAEIIFRSKMFSEAIELEII